MNLDPRLFVFAGILVAAVVVQALLPSAPALQPNPRTTGWHTSRVVGSPEPPPPYSVQLAFPNLRFETPIEVLYDNPSDTYVVAQQDGKVLAFANQREIEQSWLLLDVKAEEDWLENLWGVALHPRLEQMPYLYAYYGGGEKLRLSRFRINLNGDRPATQDEQVLLEFTTYGHMGGALIFGPDEYLYLGIGDGTGASDGFRTGQDISDLYASVVRLDVNNTGSKPYSIPPDNPFLNHPDAQPEVWAYGVRQVWKMSYDSESGHIYGGDVGQDLWEALYRFEAGGNYGWSVNESGHPFQTNRKRGPTPILSPLVSHPHYEMRSITAGHVYRGTRLPELNARFIYGGYDSGTIWGVDTEPGSAPQLLADTSLRISCFGRNDRSGEVLAVDHASGRLFEIVPNTKQTNPADFPHLLSETGLFESVKDQVPADGVISIDVNSPLWSDGAVKKRFMAIPGDKQIDFEKITYLALDEPGWRGWQFPDGTVLVKTFYLDVQTDDGIQR
ncbi:MAG: sorbosone dehydrogenase family protein, partial [Planctomycetaceae bacterium]